MGFGDLIQQRCAQWKHLYFDDASNFADNESTTPILQQCSNNSINHDSKNGIILANITDPKIIDNHDFIRTRNMITVGLIQGPFHHYFYSLLERFVPGKNASSVVKKTCIDQVIASPICLAIFFIGLSALEERKTKELFFEIKSKFIETYKVDCCFWPPSQLINFLFVPMRYRVMYINFMTMFYDIFLSHTKYVS